MGLGKSRKRKILLVIAAIPLVLLLLFIGLFIYAIFFSKEPSPFMTHKEWLQRNPPTAQLSELNWLKEQYKLFYIEHHSDAEKIERDKEGLYSQMSDGADKKFLYQGMFTDYFLLDKDRKILIIDYSRILLINDDGSNQQIIYDKPAESCHFNHYRLSLDQKSIVLACGHDHYPQSDLVTVINIATKEVYELDKNKDLFFNDQVKSMYVDNMYWLGDNRHILLRLNKYVPDPTLSQIIIFDTMTKKAKLIGEYTHTNASGESGLAKRLNQFVDINELVLPQINANSEDNYLDSYLINNVTSPDRKKTLMIKGDEKHKELLVNNQKVMSWDEIHPYTNVYSYFNWLPDSEHIFFSSSQDATYIGGNESGSRLSGGMRMLEVSTGKIAALSGVTNVKWFDEKVNSPIPNDWKPKTNFILRTFFHQP